MKTIEQLDSLAANEEFKADVQKVLRYGTSISAILQNLRYEGWKRLPNHYDMEIVLRTMGYTIFIGVKNSRRGTFVDLS